MSFSILAGAEGFTLGQNGGTTDEVDTLTARLIILIFSYAGTDIVAGDISDTKNLTWIPTDPINTGDPAQRVFYAIGSGIGDANHEFTLAAVNSFSSVFVIPVTCDGGETPEFEDLEGDANTSPIGTINLAGYIPAENNELNVSGFCSISSAGGSSVADTTLTLLSGQVPLVPGSAYGVAAAAQIQTTAGTNEITWVTNVPSHITAAVFSFKLASSPSSGKPTVYYAQQRIH